MKNLTPAQVYGVCWMESRLADGGGFIGDECGMGKVYCTHAHADKKSEANEQTVQTLTWLILRKARLKVPGYFALVIV